MPGVWRRLAVAFLSCTGLVAVPDPIAARPVGGVELTVDYRATGALDVPSPSAVRRPSGGGAVARWQRLVDHLSHRAWMLASSSAADTPRESATSRFAAASVLLNPPPVVAANVQSWPGRISRAGTWYATTVQTNGGPVVLRSNGGGTWTSIGWPASYPASAGPAAVDEAGRVFLAYSPVTDHYEYDAAGQLVATVDAVGARVEMTYDLLGRLATRTQMVRQPSGPPQGLTWSFTYNSVGDLLTEVSPEGRAVGDRVSSTNQSGETVQFEFDVAGRLIAAEDPLGRQTEGVYDLAGRLTSVVRRSPAGGVLTTELREYDSAGNLTRASTPLGAATPSPSDYSTSYAYNAMSWLTEVERSVAVGQVVEATLRYDAQGNRTAQVDGRGNVTTVDYNSWNLPSRVIEPATFAHPNVAERSWSMAYDAGGLPVELREPGDVQRVTTFNAHGVVSAEAATDGVTTWSKSFGRTKLGQVSSFGAPDGTVSVVYDDRGLLLSTSGPARLSSAFSYDDDGLMLTRSDASGSTSFGWTSDGRLATLSDPLLGESLAYTYDEAGQLSSIASSTGVSYTYGWDDLGRQVSSTIRNPSGAIASSRTLDYDLNGNLVSQLVHEPGNPQAGLHSYVYDMADRLVEWDHPVGEAHPFAYDLAGNLVLDGAVSSAYDARNRRISSSDGAVLGYNPRGGLESVSAGGVVTASYEYDGFGRAEVVGGVAVSYDDRDRMSSYGGIPLAFAGFLPDPSKFGAESYSRTPAGDLVAASNSSWSGWVVPDSRGDVSTMVATSGSVGGSRVFAPYGEVAGSSGHSIRVGFQGDVTAPTGELWMHARWFSPADGGFISRDPFGGFGSRPSSWNRYAYAEGNPLVRWDPTGYAAEDSPGAAAGQSALEAVSLGVTISRRPLGDVSASAAQPLISFPTQLVVAFDQPSPQSYWGMLAQPIRQTIDGIVAAAETVYNGATKIASCASDIVEEGGQAGCWQQFKKTASEVVDCVQSISCLWQETKERKDVLVAGALGAVSFVPIVGEAVDVAFCVAGDVMSCLGIGSVGSPGAARRLVDAANGSDNAADTARVLRGASAAVESSPASRASSHVLAGVPSPSRVPAPTRSSAVPDGFATNIAPLSDEMAATFRGSQYSGRVLTEDTVLYRAGTADQSLGQFFSAEKPVGVVQTRIDKAIPPVWPGGQPAPLDTGFAVRIPAGTTVYDGVVANQGGWYMGGTGQIVVQKPWTIPGVEVLESWPLK